MLITYKATTEGTNHLKHLLQAYSTSTGQHINTSKWTIIHHPNLEQHQVIELQQTFGMPTTSNPPTYLGVQFKQGRTSQHIFAPLLQRLARKAKWWMTKCLNQAGRLVLIKTSLTPTSNHLMQTQLLPSHIHQKMDRITRDFFWGHDSTVRKLHPIGFDKLIKPKSKGGLGIRSSKEHNKALLMKRIWNIHEKPNSIVASLYNEKYLKHQPILHNIPPPPSSTSPLWRNLSSLIPTLKKHLFHQIGNDSTTPIQANWIPQFENNIDPTVCYPIQSVADIIDPLTRSWNHKKLNILAPNTVQRIVNLHLPHENQPDRIIWPFTKSGKYTTTSGYKFLTDISDQLQHNPPPPSNQIPMDAPLSTKSTAFLVEST